MIYYRGDSFVRGKKFLVNESPAKLLKKTSYGYIFESIKDKSRIVIKESDVSCIKEMM